MRTSCNVNTGTLWERAIGENIDWINYPEWIAQAMAEQAKMMDSQDQ